MKKSTQLQFTDHSLKFIKASKSGRRLTPSGKRITEGTVTNYEHVYDLIEVFENKSIDKLRIQLFHRASMRTLQRQKNYWKRFFIHFSNFLYKEKNYYDNYAGNVFKTSKTFLNYLQKEKDLW